ncbi:UNVERIFIED_CONTAM: dockerin type I repeat protein [Acetivibrio alkalicellulosi]
MLNLKKRLVLFSLISILVYSIFGNLVVLGNEAQNYMNGLQSIDFERIELPSNAFITDVVVFEEEGLVFAVDAYNKAVHEISIKAGKIRTVNIGESIEKIDYHNDKIYVTVQKDSDSSYPWEESQKGGVAVIDAISMEFIEMHPLEIDPFDIVAGRDSNIYVTPRTGQWSEPIYSYSENFEKVDSSSIRHKSYAKFHPEFNRIYTIDTDVSPRNYKVFNIDSGEFKESYNSPYHGDYSLERYFEISPDGKYLFNGSGNVFSCNEEKDQDMIFVSRLETSFDKITFDMSKDMFFTSLRDNIIHVYRYEDFEHLSVIYSKGSISKLFYVVGKLCALSMTDDGMIFEVVETEYLNTTIPYISKILIPGSIDMYSYNKSRNILYACDSDERMLYFINLSTDSVLHTIELSFKPSDIVYSDYTNSIYVVSLNNKLIEIDASTYVITNEIDIDLPVYERINSNLPLHFHVKSSGNKLFLVDSSWEPGLWILDLDDYTISDYTDVANSIGDLVISSDGSTLYTWHQFGWDAGWAGSYISRYSIEEDAIELIETSDKEYGNGMYKNPLDTPILISEERGIVVCKNMLFDINDFSESLYDFGEDIYAINKAGTLAVSKKNVYNLMDNSIITKVPVQSPRYMFFNEYRAIVIIDKSGSGIYQYGTCPIEPEINTIMYGDINGDGSIDSTDVALLRRHLLQISGRILEGEALLAADVNKDGSVNSTDYALMRRYILGIITEFPG